MNPFTLNPNREPGKATRIFVELMVSLEFTLILTVIFRLVSIVFFNDWTSWVDEIVFSVFASMILAPAFHLGFFGWDQKPNPEEIDTVEEPI